MKKPKTVNVRIREDLKNKLKEKAAKKGISLQQYLEDILKPNREVK